MSCTIKLNVDGSINNVLTPDGKESRLFKQIARLPHINSLEEALEIFKNTYSEKMGVFKKEKVSEPQKVELDQEALDKLKKLSQDISMAATPKIKDKLQKQADNFMEDVILKNLQENKVLQKEC